MLVSTHIHSIQSEPEMCELTRSSDGVNSIDNLHWHKCRIIILNIVLGICELYDIVYM